jgi:hypothetical protein
MQSWKKAVFFGGAVLVLAACSDATSPTSPALNRIDGPAASLTKKADSMSTESTTSSDSTNTISNDCNGVIIHWGTDGTIVPVCIQIITNY